MELLRVYDCLCDATRLRLLNLLAARPLCVCHIEAVLRLPQAKISRHLAYLRRHGMVATEQVGNWRIYALVTPPPPGLAANLACLQDARATDPVLHRAGGENRLRLRHAPSPTPQASPAFPLIVPRRTVLA
ncbi:MAG: helix-turn-helix transcriptional regulator [Opitutae bacterium]|nr:helix-turn-helix transcriptional regulator [Opitutae bacterium]